MLVKTEYLVNGDSRLWRLFPVINVDRTKDIPKDYPGAMGVPISFLDKRTDQYEILNLYRGSVNGRLKYARIIIRNTQPELPEYVDINDLLEKAGSNYRVDFEVLDDEESRV